MRLQERAGYFQQPILLEPFGHQVAGQASMLSVDANTVCKPLISREHFLYCTLPPQLAPFTPQYKGVLYVRLDEEEDGRIKLWGYYPEQSEEDNSGVDHPEVDRVEEHFLQVPSEYSSGTSTPLSSGSEPDEPSALNAEQIIQASRSPAGCIVRALEGGTYEVSVSSDANDRFIVMPHRSNIRRRNIESEGGEETHEKSISAISSHSLPGPGSLHLPLIQPLNPWGLSCHTRLLDKMRKSPPSNRGCPFLLLENVVSQFTRPCILDLKVGSRLHGDDANQKKIASQTGKCQTTTSRSLGLRLCGMQVYQVDTGTYKSHDKYYGRTLTDATFQAVLREFLHNGRWLRRELLNPVLSRLNSLLLCLKELTSYRFYASSLLIMYDGYCQDLEHMCSNSQSTLTKADDTPQTLGQVPTSLDVFEASSSVETKTTVVKPSSKDKVLGVTTVPTSSKPVKKILPASLAGKDSHCTNVVLCSENGNASNDPHLTVDVRMIDFAHTTHSGFPNDQILHDGPDLDYIWGIENLITLFSQLFAEDS